MFTRASLALLNRVPQGSVVEHPEQSMSPGDEPVEVLLEGSLQLQYQELSRHLVTIAATWAGNAARSFRERSINDISHLAETATDSTLPELRRLGLYTKVFLPDVTHRKHESESVVENACATTNVRRYSAGEETDGVPNTFKEATTLPAKARWKVASDKEATKS